MILNIKLYHYEHSSIRLKKSLDEMYTIVIVTSICHRQGFIETLGHIEY